MTAVVRDMLRERPRAASEVTRQLGKPGEWALYTLWRDGQLVRSTRQTVRGYVYALPPRRPRRLRPRTVAEVTAEWYATWGPATVREYAEDLGLSYDTARKRVGAAVRAGLVWRGAGRGGRVYAMEGR